MAGKLGLGLLETLLENLDRDLNLANTTLTNPIITTNAIVSLDKIGTSAPATVTANATAASAPLTQNLFQRVDSTNDAHKVQLPLAESVGQIIILTNVDDAQDAVVRNNADNTTVVTLGEGKGAVLVATATGDNWVAAVTGA